ncbi:hypothetical protein [Pusillimonas minor]|uniref:Uncharacterized protein n=1 Tax=Pusillimonas minor TaxID=2697024 RepID=A0A842HJU3_9BURK|nr:hypothetical protein [Pusillimonas minor]MBC2768556.1 hypothetical protein [Pusillimonas minor]
MKTTLPIGGGFAGGLAATLGPAIKSFAQAKGGSIMAGAQGALMGAKTAEAGENARGLAMTNNARVDPFAVLNDPQIAEYISKNPSYANALRTGLAVFGATGEGDIATMLSKIQGADLTGQGVERGNAGDLPGQNRLVSAATGKTYEPFKAVGETGYVVDGGTGGMTRSAPGMSNVKPTTLMQNLAAAGFVPGTPEYQQAVLNGTRQGTTVNVGAGDKAWDTESAKLFAKRYDDITAGAMNAQQMMGMYDLAEQALDSGVRTGFGADTEIGLRQFGAALGIDTSPEKLAGGELIRAIQNRMALAMRSPDGGMGMPGALSDRDIQFLKDSQVGIDRSPEGNRRMLQAFRAMEKRKIELSKLADDYIEKNGRLDTGFNAAVRQYANQNPLFESAGSAVSGPAQPANTAKGPGRQFEYEGRRGIMYQDGSYEWVN